MSLKPKKPKKSLFGKLKPLDDATKASKKTKADTKALETVQKELEKATKDLETKMTKSFQCYEKAYKAIPDAEKCARGDAPLPIPYPKLKKMEKEAKSAQKDAEQALTKHEKLQKKAVKVIDKQITELKPAAKSSKGDEAATLKGLVAARAQGKVLWTQYAMDVKHEGSKLIRFFDLTTQNHR